LGLSGLGQLASRMGKRPRLSKDWTRETECSRSSCRRSGDGGRISAAATSLIPGISPFMISRVTKLPIDPRPMRPTGRVPSAGDSLSCCLL